MPWVQFSRDFDWSPVRYGGRVTVAYRAGMRLLVTTACAKAAKAVERAQIIPKPKDQSHAGRPAA